MQNRNIKIGILGDICPVDEKTSFNVHFEEDTFVLGNLECVLTDHPHPVKKAGPVLYAPESFAATLKAWGFDAMSLANNHIRDCGDEGVCSTIEACQKNGIYIFGAGETEEKASAPLIIEKNGLKVAFLSFAEKEFNYVHDGKAGAQSFDPYESLDKIRSLRNEVDTLIVLYHGGIEHYIYPSPLLRKKCRKIVEAGADIVLCQHSHCIGTRERYGKGEILYGQGNGLFGYRKGNETWNHGMLVQLEISDNDIITRYDILENSKNGTIGLASSTVAKKLLSQFEKESTKLSDKNFLTQSWRLFCERKRALYMPMLYGLGTNANRLNRLLHNRLIDFLYTRQQKNVTHNLIRCDAHQELIDCLLSTYDFE